MKTALDRYGKLALAALWLLYVYAAGFSGWVAEDEGAFLRAAEGSSYLNGSESGEAAAVTADSAVTLKRASPAS